MCDTCSWNIKVIDIRASQRIWSERADDDDDEWLNEEVEMCVWVGDGGRFQSSMRRVLLRYKYTPWTYIIHIIYDAIARRWKQEQVSGGNTKKTKRRYLWMSALQPRNTAQVVTVIQRSWVAFEWCSWSGPCLHRCALWMPPAYKQLRLLDRIRLIEINWTNNVYVTLKRWTCITINNKKTINWYQDHNIVLHTT